MKQGKFNNDIFYKVKYFDCPCCHLYYAANTDTNKYEFDENFGSGSATRLGDNIFECTMCKTVFDVRTLDIVQKPLKECHLKNFKPKELGEALSKLKTISDVELVGKTLQYQDANGNNQQLDVLEAILLANLAKTAGVEQDIKLFAETEAENEKIRKENDDLAKRFPNILKK